MLADVLPRYQETANGSKKQFTTPFSLMKAEFVNVYVDNVKQTNGYSVNIDSNKVTFTTAPANQKLITIIRVLPINWEITSLGSINQKSLENAFTLLTAKLQTLEEEISRAPKTNPYDEETGEDISALFIQEMRDALDSLAQAQVVYSQVQAAGSQALSDISTNKTTAITAINNTASDRTGEFNQNASSKTTAFNSNAETAVDNFNANATSKTNTFNTNATNKTSDFNTNATNKTNTFNTNATQKQAAVDASASAAATSETNAAASATAAANSAANALATEGRIDTKYETMVLYSDWDPEVI